MPSEPFAARLTSIWIGGLFFWVFRGFRGKFYEMISEKYDNRNMWVGYTIQLIILVGTIYFLFIKS